jgi:hypothetical protein
MIRGSQKAQQVNLQTASKLAAPSRFCAVLGASVRFPRMVPVFTTSGGPAAAQAEKVAREGLFSPPNAV